MPRPKRSKLSLTQESIEKHMNEVYGILEHYKQMGVRHYNFVLRIIEELGSDSVEDPVRLQLMAQLEQSRNNSLNAFKEYLRMKTDLITKTQKIANAESGLKKLREDLKLAGTQAVSSLVATFKTIDKSGDGSL